MQFTAADGEGVINGYLKNLELTSSSVGMDVWHSLPCGFLEVLGRVVRW